LPLLALWQSNPEAVTALSVEQLVATAGDGKLRDGNTCSEELRSYLAQAEVDRLASYAEYCLAQSFPKSGMVLQDVVNELGRRLEYGVTNGRYQGTANEIGFDGLWQSPEGNALVVEVKTTDAYRMSLDTIATYRSRLRETGKLGASSSLLIVVGREETGELEAQVRGSRHAWDMRLISVDGLIGLVRLRESTETPVAGVKLRSVLIPMEYTKLDGLIDVMFTTAKDVEEGEDGKDPVGPKEEGSSNWQFTDPKLIQAKRELIARAFGERESLKLVKKTRATYWDSSHSHRIVCTVSKRYEDNSSFPYWYAYHPAWDAFLAEGITGHFVLGCMDLGVAFAIPLALLRQQLDKFNTTTKPDGTHYWHVKIQESRPEQYALQLPKLGSSLDLTPFMVAIQTPA
jgi:hypothetical protein